MPFPTQIDAAGGLDISTVRNMRHGPFQKASDFSLYVVGVDRTSNNVEVWKSVDGGENWLEQDSSNKPGCSSDTFGGWAVCAEQAGDLLYICYANNSPNNQYTVITFDMVTDSFGVEDTGGPTGSANDYWFPGGWGAFIHVRSNGDVVLYYTKSEKIKRLRWARGRIAIRHNGVWTNDIIVDGTGVESLYRPYASVMGSDDRIHLFYLKFSIGPLMHRVLKADNTFGPAQVAGNENASQNNYIAGTPLVYQDGVDTKIAMTWTKDRAGSTHMRVLRGVSSDSPVWTNENISLVNADGDYCGVGCAALGLGTELHVFWSHVNLRDLMHDQDGGTGTWGADQTIRPTTLTMVNCAKLLNENAIGILYMDGELKFDKLVL